MGDQNLAVETIALFTESQRFRSRRIFYYKPSIETQEVRLSTFLSNIMKVDQRPLGNIYELS